MIFLYNYYFLQMLIDIIQEIIQFEEIPDNINYCQFGNYNSSICQNEMTATLFS